MLFGGGNGTGGYLSNVVDIYDAGSGNWSSATLRQAGEGVVATSAGTKAFFAGGLTNNTVVDIYDAETNTWSYTNLSQGALSPCGHIGRKQGFFAGGFFGCF